MVVEKVIESHLRYGVGALAKLCIFTNVFIKFFISITAQ